MFQQENNNGTAYIGVTSHMFAHIRSINSFCVGERICNSQQQLRIATLCVYLFTDVAIFKIFQQNILDMALKEVIKRYVIVTYGLSQRYWK